MLHLLLEQVVLVQEEDLLADVRRQEMITGGDYTDDRRLLEPL